MTSESPDSSKPSRPRRDPFTTLALVSIVLGMMIVVGGVVFWAVTGRESSLVIGTGVALTIGGPLSDRFGESVRRMSELSYYSRQNEQDADGSGTPPLDERTPRKRQR